MKKKRLLIFGTGTLGEIAAYYFQNDTNYDLIGFVDSVEFLGEKKTLLEKPLLSWESAKKQYSPSDIEFFIAIGYRKMNSLREMRFQEVRSAGFRCATYISSKATVISEKIGENCFILENNVIQPFVDIGDNVTMWSGNHIGHHSVIENNVFITSHVVISGKCRIGANSFLGVNCCLHDGVSIGDRSLVGAGSIVTDSCEQRTVFLPNKTESRVVRRDLI